MELVDLLKNSEALAQQHTREILGNRQNLPADESAIAWNSKLTHEEKVEKLTALRSEKVLRRAARKAARAN
jgi:hypothetical protein